MKYLLVLLIASFLGACTRTPPAVDGETLPVAWEQQLASPSPASEFMARFFIYTNGTKRIFTNEMYHQLSPEAYITAEDPAQVVVKKAGITWQEFFNTLPFSLSETCLVAGTKQTFCSSSTSTLKFYLNGVVTPEALQKVIQPGDELLVSFGPLEDKNIEEQLASFE